jgi:hypothetical protein
VPAQEGGEAADFQATADVTSETAERHPEWTIDLTDEAVDSWRGEEGNVASVALVWGRPLVDGAAIATAELADLTVDQCVLVEERFTLIAPDDYRGDLLDVKLFDRNGRELASESLYEDDPSDD